MSFLKRMGFGRPETPRSQPKPKEQEMVFEEVPDDEPEDFTYKEDPTQAMAERILTLEQDLEGSQGDERQQVVMEVLLAKARYEQAAANERAGRSKRGEADRLLKEWQGTQNRLDALKEDQLQDARDTVFSRYDDDDIDADTAAQLRRHA